MLILEKSIQKFLQVLNKYHPKENSVVKIGGIHFAQNSAKYVIDERIIISPELSFFYERCKIKCDFRCHDKHILQSTGIDLGNGALLEFFPPENLVQAHYGFRWVGTGEKCMENSKWNSSWTIIASANDHDAIVVITDKENSPVFVSIGGGDIFPIADSFHEFLDVLTTVIELIYAKYDGEIMDRETDYSETSQGFMYDLRNLLVGSNDNTKLMKNFIKYLYE